jgi:ribonuclease HII
VTAALGTLDRRLLERASAVIGVDEVGRGSLEGPVVVSAVAFKQIPDHEGVRDSKRLTPKRREEVAQWTRDHCFTWTAVEVWVEVIDRVNILEATRLAMRAAVRSVAIPLAVVVTDGVELGELGGELKEMLSPTKADANYFCVAAASIVAKVYRDRLMVDLAGRYPHWKWNRNKGYGTAQHRLALGQTGAGFLHRGSFSWSRVLP